MELDRDSFTEILKARKDSIMEDAIDNLVRYLRQIVRDKGEIDAYDELQAFLNAGAIKLDLFLQLKQIIDNPEIDYTITKK